MVQTRFLYENAEGEQVEATSHEFVTRLRSQGFRRVEETPKDVEVSEVTPEVEHDVEQPENTTKKPRGNPMDPRDKKLPY